jgi:hypothetical protein
MYSMTGATSCAGIFRRIHQAWKRKYEALGWKYGEKNGVATFDPVDGARNEGGEIYSAERGGFVRPEAETPVVPPRLPRDGDVNERGEVWSSFSGGYVERKTYDQDMANQAALAEKDRSDLADMQRPDEDVAELNRKIAATRQQGREMRTYFKARDELLGALGDQRDREGVDALLNDSRSGLFDELSDRLLTTPADNDYRKGLQGLLPLADVIGNQMRPGYTPTYTYKDAAQTRCCRAGGGARRVLTKGWATGGRQFAGDADAAVRRWRSRSRPRGQVGGDRLPVRQGHPLRRRYAGEAWRRQERGAPASPRAVPIFRAGAPRSPPTWSRRCAKISARWTRASMSTARGGCALPSPTCWRCRRIRTRCGR